jgi:hypothetical protein
MANVLPGSREELLQYLDQLAGHSIRTRAELEAYLNELKARGELAQAKPLDRRWAIAKQAVLGVGLLIAVLQYYLIDIYVEILSLQRVQFINPADSALLRRSALELVRFFC